MPFGFETISLQCPDDVIGPLVVEGIGINQEDLAIKDYCQVTNLAILQKWFDKRGISFEIDGKVQDNSKCSKLIDSDWFAAEL